MSLSLNQSNASLIFKKLVTNVPNPDNPYVESLAEYNDFTIQLSIEEGSIRELKNEGQRKDYITCDGRLVSPLVLPVEFRSQREARIIIHQNSDNSFPLEGIAYIKPQLNSRMGFESFFGEYIQLDVRLD